MSNLKVGEQAPNFTLLASNGEEVSLEDFRGQNVVLYFYPKDMTPGCTTQAKDFRNDYPQFKDLEAVVLGVSPDSFASHEKFINKHDLPFLLLVDDEQKVAQLYDVWKLKKMFGREYMGIERSTFLIDKEGHLVKEWRKVRVAGHVNEVMEEMKKLA